MEGRKNSSETESSGAYFFQFTPAKPRPLGKGRLGPRLIPGIPAEIEDVDSSVLEVQAPGDEKNPFLMGERLYLYLLRLASDKRVDLGKLLSQYRLDSINLAAARAMVSNALAQNSSGDRRSHSAREIWLDPPVLRVALEALEAAAARTEKSLL